MTTAKKLPTKAPTGAKVVSAPRKKPSTQDRMIAEWDQICAMVEEGQTVTQIAARYKCSIGMFGHIQRKDPELAAKYTRARENSADAFEAEIVETARNGTGDPQADRLLVDTMKWVAARRNFKRYGDKQVIEADVNMQVTKVEVEFK
jgi:hypothetical protein